MYGIFGAPFRKARVTDLPTTKLVVVRDRSQVRQPIDVLHLTRVAHIVPVRALRRFMTQIGHSDVRAILLKQLVNAILAAPAALGAFHPMLSGAALSERVGTVGHVTCRLSVRSARARSKIHGGPKQDSDAR
jgi:hypothetical protein